MADAGKTSALKAYVGRRCIYIEDGVFSVAQVASVHTSDDGMSAVLERLKELPLVCYYREKPPRFADVVSSGVDRSYLGAGRWEIAKKWESLYIDDDIWDGSIHLGFRILFAPDVVERFLARDLSWIDEYF